MKRILYIAAWTAAALIVLLYLGLPAAFGLFAVLPGQTAVGNPPEGFEAVTLRTKDGVALEGWYHPPQNGAVIVLLHGAGGSRADMRPYAQMLVGSGYGALLFDQRGHGTSAGRTNRLGWQGTDDVGAAVQFLQGRPEVNAIGGLGISMGGEALLGASAAYPEIQAIATDGATRRCTAELLALEKERPLVRNFTARVMYATVQLLSGERPPPPLLPAMVAAEKTEYLLIAAGEEDLEVDFNRLFQDTLGGRAQLWIAPEVGHTGAFGRYPQLYEERLIAFFDAVLLDRSAARFQSGH